MHKVLYLKQVLNKKCEKAVLKIELVTCSIATILSMMMMVG